ncbi:protein BCCIP homolog [Hordeum vulgare subsp. vulgare]|uniref:Protein BCCIP homolog n=1 Tax=Hordeum vulgare subsp. vulgare TaxID=112509 RepID=A0A8I6XVP9_HORVV|nr:protein BCCIP homolog [Hordeum vulgare subsp. vulgare]
MPAGRKRPAPAPFAGFSTFARSLLFSPASGFSRLPLTNAPAAKPHQETAGMRPPASKRAKQAEPSSDEEEERPSSDAEADSDGDGDSDSDSDSSLECSSSDDDDDASQEMETVQADFAFFDPKPTDFHGVRLLLKTYLDSKPWDLTGFVDLVLEQTTVGTVVKMAEDEDGEANGGDKSDEGDDDDEDLFGLITVLNLGRYGESRCIKDLKEYLLAVCGDKDTKKKLKSLLEEKASTVGLLVCRRFVNFPYEMVPKMYDSLFDEVSWATEDEPTQELQDSFRFKQYLFLVRILERKTPPKQKSKNNKDEDEPVIYPKLEDEILRELSTWSFTFPIRAEQSAQQELKNYKEMGLVMCVKADVIPKFRKKLEALVSE